MMMIISYDNGEDSTYTPFSFEMLIMINFVLTPQIISTPLATQTIIPSTYR